jgi:hypothetical protein
MNAPAAFIHPCQPIVAKQPSTGPAWAHELKHGYRLQIHVGDGRVRLYTINGADWSKRYPLISESAGASKALPFLMLKSCGSIQMECRSSMLCTASMMRQQQPSPLIF